jgi:hypothetical protein
MMLDAEQMKAFVQEAFDDLRQRVPAAPRIGSRDAGRGCLTPHSRNAAERAVRPARPYGVTFRCVRLSSPTSPLRPGQCRRRTAEQGYAPCTE